MAEAQNKSSKGGRLPPWMTEPGAPARPDFSGYSKTLTELNAKKDQLLQEIKDLQGSVRTSDGNEELRTERDALRASLNEIDLVRKNERTIRIKKNEEITALRKKRRENADKVRGLQLELGGFTSVKEIDAAIEYMKRKMEWTGGGLEAEKKNNRRLHQLEEAKGLLVQLQPLTEAIQAAQEREVKLAQEYREIHERIGILNKKYEEELSKKRKLDAQVAESSSGRTEVYKKCDELRTQLNGVFEEMRKIKAERQEKIEAWDAWCVTAKQNYAAKQEAEAKKRLQQDLEEQQNAKLEAKRARAKQRQNPFLKQIENCEVLVQYLKDKQQMINREEDKRRKALAAEAFDPRACVPDGCQVLHEGTFSKTEKTKRAVEKKIVVRHPNEKVMLFDSIDVRPPSEPEKISECIEDVKRKKAEFESHIKAGECDLSSDHEDEGEAEKEEMASTD